MKRKNITLYFVLDYYGRWSLLFFAATATAAAAAARHFQLLNTITRWRADDHRENESILLLLLF